MARRALAEPSTATAALLWPQRYAQLQEAHVRLQQTLVAQEATHRRALTVVKYEPSLPNNDVFTKELLEQNHALQQRCRTLELQLAKLDRGRASASFSSQRSVDRTVRKSVANDGRATTRPNVKHAEVQTEAVDNNSEEIAVCENNKDTKKPVVPEQVQSLVGMLKQRLLELDLDLSRLQQENEMLRAKQPTPTAVQDTHSQREQFYTHAQQQELEHLLHDRMRQMKILEEQFTHLQHKIKSKTILYRESLDKVEQLTSELFDAKQTLMKQAEWLHAQEDANAQLRLLEKEVHVLRNENATLNETVSVMSARPLEALNIQLEKKALQLFLLDEKDATLEAELKRASQDHHIVMQTNEKLRRRAEMLTKQLEAPLKEIQELKAERERLISEREIATTQLQFYMSGDSMESKELMEAVGRALKLMRAEQAEHRSAEPRVSPRQPHKEKCETQVNTLQSERAEKMAHVTKLIQDETRAQLQDQKIAHHAHVRDLQRQCVRWQQRANEYLKEITMLQRSGPSKASDPHAKRLMTSNVDRLHTSTSVRVPTSQVEETLMEVRLYDLRSSIGSRTDDPAAFVLFCDYFDFESQPSPVFSLGADVATVEMEVSYKLLVDQAFCRSPVAQSLTIELHHLGVAAARIVGAADVSLQSLFLSERGYMAMSGKLREPTTRVTIGSVRVAMSLTRPVRKLFQAWYKGDFARVRPMPRLEPSSVAGSLHVCIRLVAIALTKEEDASTVTSRYRFMGNPLVRYTTQTAPTISYGFSVFRIDRSKTFEVPSEDHMVAFLERHEMALEIETPGGMRGEANVRFQSVARGVRVYHCGSAIVSVVVSAVDHSTDQQRHLGRVWLELQAIDAKAVEAIDAAKLHAPAQRVFGDADGLHIDWHCFCEVMEFTSAERGVRQLLSEKLKTKGGDDKGLQLVRLLEKALRDSVEDLSSLFQRADLLFSRSELCLISSSLIVSDLGDSHSDEPASIRRSLVEKIKRLQLLTKTVDEEWLRIEPLLRNHVETLGILAKHPQSDPGAEWIAWDVFVRRIRLMK